ncbi:ImmA/IrrE family metallo-endopeptidase [Deinococcus frigens]|uniref:ImmA/IrrE family metallo-endopeptidase n=1 Tax=Deinococcus frigens TaxID=249403 RepID=UPI000496B4D9|nr:ImmA/IrrE family metallo-endopeptidase [Deinococcus frigens]
MRYATQDFLAFSRAQHAQHDYEPDPRRLAHLLDIQIITGRTNRGSAGPPAVIQLARDLHVARRRFTLLHEINHVLMQRAGLERDVAAEVDEEDADAHIEAVVNHAAAQMILPDPMVNIVCGMYGDTPEAIFNLAVAGQASLPAALHRWVSRDPDAYRAAFITSGSYVAHVGTCNSRLPFWRFDRIPEVALAVPDAELRQVPRRQAAVLGTVAW